MSSAPTSFWIRKPSRRLILTEYIQQLEVRLSLRKWLKAKDQFEGNVKHLQIDVLDQRKINEIFSRTSVERLMPVEPSLLFVGAVPMMAGWAVLTLNMG